MVQRSLRAADMDRQTLLKKKTAANANHTRLYDVKFGTLMLDNCFYDGIRNWCPRHQLLTWHHDMVSAAVHPKQAPPKIYLLEPACCICCLISKCRPSAEQPPSALPPSAVLRDLTAGAIHKITMYCCCTTGCIAVAPQVPQLQLQAS
jgi:hypothetical protein